MVVPGPTSSIPGALSILSTPPDPPLLLCPPPSSRQRAALPVILREGRRVVGQAKGTKYVCGSRGDARRSEGTVKAYCAAVRCQPASAQARTGVAAGGEERVCMCVRAHARCPARPDERQGGGSIAATCGDGAWQYLGLCKKGPAARNIAARGRHRAFFRAPVTLALPRTARMRGRVPGPAALVSASPQGDSAQPCPRGASMTRPKRSPPPAHRDAGGAFAARVPCLRHVRARCERRHAQDGEEPPHGPLRVPVPHRPRERPRCAISRPRLRGVCTRPWSRREAVSSRACFLAGAGSSFATLLSDLR